MKRWSTFESAASLKSRPTPLPMYEISLSSPPFSCLLSLSCSISFLPHPAHTYTLTLFTNQFVVLVFCDLFPFLAFTFSLLSPLSFWSSKFLVFFHWLEGIFFIDMTWPDWSTFQLDNFCALYYAETTFTQQRSSAWSVEETLLSITQQVHYNTVVPICCSWRKYCCSICMCNPHIHI